MAFVGGVPWWYVPVCTLYVIGLFFWPVGTAGRVVSG